MLSLRNRELASLVVVGTLVGFGFASVYIARQEVVNSASLSYGLFFLGLYIAAHAIARVTVPNADPYLLPMAGLMTGIGVTEIYRLDEHDAFRQGLWIVIGLTAFAATLFFLRGDFRKLESYKYLFGLSAIGLLLLPALPYVGKTVNGARLWVSLGPHLLGAFVAFDLARSLAPDRAPEPDAVLPTIAADPLLEKIGPPSSR